MHAADACRLLGTNTVLAVCNLQSDRMIVVVVVVIAWILAIGSNQMSIYYNTATLCRNAQHMHDRVYSQYTRMPAVGQAYFVYNCE